MSDPDFKKEKIYIWEDIGRALTFRRRTGQECKSRWRSIRDYYKKQKKEEKNGAAHVPAIKRRQVYWNSLSFLDDTDDQDELTTYSAFPNVQVEMSEDTEGFDFVDCQNHINGSELDEVSTANIPRKRRKLNEEDHTSVDEQELRTDLARSIGKNEFLKKSEEIGNKSGTLESQLKEALQEMKERLTDQEPEVKSIVSEQDGPDDEIELFFKAMAATVKKFSPKLKVETKSKIFTVVTELELKHLESTSLLQSTNCKGDQ
ncbi:uncharacterized protein LOC128987244 [Macrosteles quadrilineatus]|uniref:uncharacterized protein LOC128987244 n=1 Tax=Macrosteles quadrilineatus TaxID=74068 RepID=UPI0023E1F495|nr:uncharacterized protein LOC128987244 [Macrosteles quadrilineatus]